LLKKVIISACLLGECCRYDGKTKKVGSVVDAFSGWEIIPFCPEAPLFGTPRERISVIEKDTKRYIITDESNKDVTALLEKEILSFIQKNVSVDAIILKSKSPSCGNKTTPILNTKKEKIKLGNGIAVDIFQEHYKNIKIQDENSF